MSLNVPWYPLHLFWNKFEHCRFLFVLTLIWFLTNKNIILFLCFVSSFLCCILWSIGCPFSFLSMTLLVYFRLMSLHAIVSLDLAGITNISLCLLRTRTNLSCFMLFTLKSYLIRLSNNFDSSATNRSYVARQLI